MPTPSHPRGAARLRDDTGSIMLGWFVKIVVALAVISVVAFDSISIGAAHLSATDDANTAASAAASDFQNNHNVASAFAAAQKALTNPAEKILKTGFVIDANGTVHLELQRPTTTLVAYRIGPLKKYTVVVAEGEASPPAN